MDVEKPTNPDGLILEAWAQGFMVGSLIIMACITVANMRKGVFLHKLILTELIFGLWHGTFIFNHAPVYGWYLSVTAIFLNISWSLHNVVAWIKNKPFLSRRVSLIYIGTVILAQPYWVLEIYANFAYFNNINDLFLHTRPYEAIFRDPWWIFTTISLFHVIRTRYEFGIIEILRISPRFAVMLLAMCLSIAFIIIDILSVTDAFKSSLPVGVNPFWKLAFVFKCLTDSVILDDFKTALDRLRAFKISRLGSFAVDNSDSRSRPGMETAPWEMAGSGGRGGLNMVGDPLGSQGSREERRLRELQRSFNSTPKGGMWGHTRLDSGTSTKEMINATHIEERVSESEGSPSAPGSKGREMGQQSWTTQTSDVGPKNEEADSNTKTVAGIAK
ncbi:MAG: hypothetical protein Q9227_005805 [Pyrenula ochraceoflavens]